MKLPSPLYEKIKDQPEVDGVRVVDITLDNGKMLVHVCCWGDDACIPQAFLAKRQMRDIRPSKFVAELLGRKKSDQI